jgi:hypothetical protein
MDQLNDRCKTLTSAGFGFFLLRDDVAHCFRFRHRSKTETLPLSVYPMLFALNNAAPINVPRVTSNASANAEDLSRHGAPWSFFSSLLVVPVFATREGGGVGVGEGGGLEGKARTSRDVVGLFVVANKEGVFTSFDKKDELCLSFLAQRAAPALWFVSERERAREREEQLRAIVAISKRLAGAASVKDIAEAVGEVCPQMLKIERASVWVVSEEMRREAVRREEGERERVAREKKEREAKRREELEAAAAVEEGL